jgi:hypothetical protein
MAERAPPIKVIEQKILLVRGQKVMLDSDLAELYGVATKILNKAVTRNAIRFPDDFMFRLTAEEARALRFQSGTSNGGTPNASSGRGGRRYLPYAFTEQGVAMLSGVLNSERAVHVNIEIMRAFVRIRQLVLANAELSSKLEMLERKYDAQFKVVFDAIRELMAPPARAKRPIGFVP